jgi:hypothetical protein
MFFGYLTSGLLPWWQPIVPLLVGAAVAQFRTLRGAAIILAAMVVEYVFVIWVNVYPANLLLTRIESVSDAVIFAGIIVWAVAVARMTLDVFRHIRL